MCLVLETERYGEVTWGDLEDGAFIYVVIVGDCGGG